MQPLRETVVQPLPRHLDHAHAMTVGPRSPRRLPARPRPCPGRLVHGRLVHERDGVLSAETHHPHQLVQYRSLRVAALTAR